MVRWVMAAADSGTVEIARQAATDMRDTVVAIVAACAAFVVTFVMARWALRWTGAAVSGAGGGGGSGYERDDYRTYDEWDESYDEYDGGFW